MEQEKISIAAQIRAARGLSGMSQADLAQAAGVSSMTVKRAEGSGNPYPSEKAIQAMRDALESAGVIFLDSEGDQGLGVRLKKNR